MSDTHVGCGCPDDEIEIALEGHRMDARQQRQGPIAIYAVARECCGHYDPEALFTTREAAQKYADALNGERDYYRSYEVRQRTLYDAPPDPRPRWHYMAQTGPFADSPPRLIQVTHTVQPYDPLLPDRIGRGTLETWDSDLSAEQVAARLAVREDGAP